MRFFSTKMFDGFSTCFRQPEAHGTHCRFLHGYALKFKVTFEGEIDERNWVFDFGGMKRATATINGLSPSQYFSWLLDHTVLISEKDPALREFQMLSIKGAIQLRVMPSVGCERLAEHLFEVINIFLTEETNGRVKATRVEVFEYEKNSAGIYA